MAGKNLRKSLIYVKKYGSRVILAIFVKFVRAAYRRMIFFTTAARDMWRDIKGFYDEKERPDYDRVAPL